MITNYIQSLGNVILYIRAKFGGPSFKIVVFIVE